jgi:hypothetical protein
MPILLFFEQKSIMKLLIKIPWEKHRYVIFYLIRKLHAYLDTKTIRYSLNTSFSICATILVF